MTKKALAVFLLIVVLSPRPSSSNRSPTPAYDKVHVLLRNDFDAGTDIYVHCKSADDDLGLHVLPYQQTYNFSFYPSKIIFASTDFYCSVVWDRTTREWFDCYDENRDLKRCDDFCWWSLRRTGPCLLNQKSMQYDICPGWNKNK